LDIDVLGETNNRLLESCLSSKLDWLNCACPGLPTGRTRLWKERNKGQGHQKKESVFKYAVK